MAIRLHAPTNLLPLNLLPHIFRLKTTSAQHVASRSRDPTFENLMSNYKNVLKVVSVQDLVLATPNLSFPISTLSRLSQKLHLNRGPTAFLRKYPHIFALFYNPTESQPFFKLTETAFQISRQESTAIDESKPAVLDRLTRLLAMSVSKTLPRRSILKVWRQLGLPDDFEHSIISQNHIFELSDAHEPNTHLLKLVNPNFKFSPLIENWRSGESNFSEIRFSFKLGFPPGMKLRKEYRARVKEWQVLPYVGPYDEIREVKKSKAGIKGMEKRAVGIVHEFLSLTVEKMVEVEKISHFRKWFGIDLNVRDLFLDHPGIFYLSTKGKKHTVFLREAYERGCLIDPNPVYDVRRRLLQLVVMGRRGVSASGLRSSRIGGVEEVQSSAVDGD